MKATDLKSELAALQLDQERIFTEVTGFDTRLKKVEKELRNALNSRLGRVLGPAKDGLFMTLGLSGGSHALNWSPSVLIGFVRQNNTQYAVKIGHRWAVYSKTPLGLSQAKRSLHPEHITVLPLAFDPQEFEHAVFKAQSVFGIPITIFDRSVSPYVSSSYTTDIHDLVEKHCGSLVSHGSLSHPYGEKDYWAYIEDEDGNPYVYYSTNGSGLGYDSCINPGEPLDPLHAFFEAACYECPKVLGFEYL